VEIAFMPFSIRAAVGAVLVPLVAGVLAVPALAQTKEEKKAADAKIQVERLVLRVVDAVMTGKTAAGGYTIKANGKDDPVASPADAVDLTWRHDVFKAVQGKIFVPFTISYEAGKSLPNNVTLYVRVVPKGGGLTKDREKSPYEFEQVFTGDAVAPAAGKPVELTRRIVVSPGDHDVYVVVQPSAGAEPVKNDVMIKGVVRKFDLSLPDLWTSEFTTSSMLLIDKIEPLKEPPTQDTIVFKPYTFTGADMVLARDNEFKKTEEMTLYFHVYNPVFENKRPDITIDYEFLKKDADGEKPAMTEDGKKLVYNPQKFNAQTLPANWDPDMGFQVAPGFAIPLNLFPLGEYRINIKITDNKAQKTITRDVVFKIVS
jgi:hypothetical protein